MSHIIIFSIFVLGVLCGDRAFASSFIDDYDLFLEASHRGRFVSSADGGVLAVGIERVNGKPVEYYVRLDQSGDVDSLVETPAWLLNPPAVVLPGGKILTERPVSSATGPLERFFPDGTHDPGFRLTLDSTSSLDGFLPAADGKIWVWGRLIFDGSRRLFARLMPNGDLDPTFDSADLTFDFQSTSKRVDAVTLDGDSHLYIYGWSLFGSGREVIRISTDGVRDPEVAVSFPSFGFQSAHQTASGHFLYLGFPGLGLIGKDNLMVDGVLPEADGIVRELRKSPDGSFYITGDFSMINGVPVNGVARLTSEGRFDSGFHLPPNVNFEPIADGSLVVWGDFESFQGETRYGVAHVDTSGNLLPDYHHRYTSEGYVSSFDRMSDGSILVSGDYSWVITDGQILKRKNLIKLSPDGSLDEGFIQTFEGRNPWIAMVTADDHVIVGFDEQPPSWARYESDGAPGPELHPEFEGLKPRDVRYPTLLSDGTLSFYWSRDRSNHQRYFISRGDELSVTNEFYGSDLMPRLQSLPDGTSYYLDDDLGSSIKVHGIDGQEIADRQIGFPYLDGIRPKVTDFALLPEERKLVVGTTGVSLIDSYGNGIQGFGNSLKSEVGISRFRRLPQVWGLPERGQYFLAGWFGDNAEELQPGFVQIRIDGSIVPEFDLGSGVTWPPRSIIALDDGDLLVGGWRSRVSIDGLRISGIVKVRPVPQVISPPPPAPTNVSAAATSGLTIGLAWTSPQEAEELLIERRRSDSDLWELVARLDSEIESYEDFAERGATYFYRISSSNVHGSSAIVIPVTTPEDELLGGSLMDERIDLLDNAPINAIHRLRTGKYLVAGKITFVGDEQVQPGDDSIIIRLNSDGSFDPTFTPFGRPWQVFRDFAEQDDGKILVAVMKDPSAPYNIPLDFPILLRLNTDGTLDPSFAGIPLTDGPMGQPGFARATMLRRLSNGNILVGGRFDGSFKNEEGNWIRQTAGGVILDPTGVMVTPPGSDLQSQYRILINRISPSVDGGFYILSSSLDGLPKVNADGTIGESLPMQVSSSHVWDRIFGIHRFASGHTLVGGAFGGVFWREETEDGWISVEVSNLVMIDPDGGINLELSEAFGAGLDGEIVSIVSLPSGKALIMGTFTQFMGEPRSHLAVIGADGTLDPAIFDISGRTTPGSVKVMENGEVFAIGSFGIVNGESRGGLVRFKNDLSELDDQFHARLYSFSPETIRGRVLHPGSDGDLYVAGRFDLVRKGNVVHQSNSIFRLDSEGEIDLSFSSREVFGEILSLDTDSSRNVIVGGEFSTTPNSLIFSPKFKNLAKLDPDGLLQFSIEDPERLGTGVRAVVVDDSDRIYVSGTIYPPLHDYDGAILRYQNSGEFDPTFPSLVNSSLYKADDFRYLDGRIIVVSRRGGPILSYDLEGEEADDLLIDHDFSYLGARFLNDGRLIGIGFVPGSQLANERSVALFASNPSVETIWETTFDQGSWFGSYSKEPGSLYVAGNLILGGRETSVVSFDPDRGFRSSFEAGKCNGDTYAVSRVGDRIAVTGNFSEWSEEPRFGLAFLNPSPEAPEPPTSQAFLSPSFTLLRWEPSPAATAYRIEAREHGSEEWEIVGYHDNSSGIFLLDEGTESGGRDFRLIVIDRAGAESSPALTQSTTEISFNLWKDFHGLDEGISPDSDIDGDSIPLLVEYALGLNPATHSQLPLPEIANGRVSYQIDSLRPDVECLIQVSDDFIEWRDYGNSRIGMAAQNPLRVSGSLSSPPGKFFRIHCSLRDSQ